MNLVCHPFWAAFEVTTSDYDCGQSLERILAELDLPTEEIEEEG
jgi:hypothetical protein